MAHHEYLPGEGTSVDLSLSPLTTTTTETNNTNNNYNNNNDNRTTEYSERTLRQLVALRLEYVLGIVSISLALASLMLALKFGLQGSPS